MGTFLEDFVTAGSPLFALLKGFSIATDGLNPRSTLLVYNSNLPRRVRFTKQDIRVENSEHAHPLFSVACQPFIFSARPKSSLALRIRGSGTDCRGIWHGICTALRVCVSPFLVSCSSKPRGGLK